MFRSPAAEYSASSLSALFHHFWSFTYGAAVLTEPRECLNLKPEAGPSPERLVRKTLKGRATVAATHRRYGNRTVPNVFYGKDGLDDLMRWARLIRRTLAAGWGYGGGEGYPRFVAGRSNGGEERSPKVVDPKTLRM